MAEQTTKLDTLIFKLEKLFFIADCMSDRVGSPESFSLAFYALLDEIQGLETVYQQLETPLSELV